MIKPLFVSGGILKENSTGGQIERIFLQALLDRNFMPTIFTSDKVSIKEPLIKELETILIEEKEYKNYIPAILRRIGLAGITFNPDATASHTWGNSAMNDIKKKKFDFSKYDYIHSTSYPCVAHLIAYEIKKQTSLPWIANFYDPWNDNPYRKFLTKGLKEKDLAKERLVAENADIIIHNNHQMYNLWLDKYGDIVKSKMFVMPMILKTDKAPNIKKDKDEKLIISHIGNFIFNRRSDVFINAVKNLFDEHPEMKGQLQVNYIGMVTNIEKDLINKYGLESVFNITGTISEQECINYYEQTDLFLAIDGKNAKNIFFPSKIMKYFYYQKPILGITPKDSVLTSELGRSRHTAIDNDNIEEITKYLHTAITDYSSLNSFEKDYWKNFSVEEIMQQYIAYVNKLLNI